MGFNSGFKGLNRTYITHTTHTNTYTHMQNIYKKHTNIHV